MGGLPLKYCGCWGWTKGWWTWALYAGAALVVVVVDGGSGGCAEGGTELLCELDIFFNKLTHVVCRINEMK